MPALLDGVDVAEAQSILSNHVHARIRLYTRGASFVDAHVHT